MPRLSSIRDGMKHGRVTQHDVARVAGVSRATVSMAFKGDPSISEKTRQRVRAAAKRLGYAPDPMLSALAVYRSRNRPPSFHGTLAWLVNSAFGYDWRKIPQFLEYYEGAVARAKHHGFAVELFDLHERNMTPARLVSIMRARSIRGVLLCPQPRSGTTLDLPWQDFSSVTFGYTLTSPHLTTVISTQYQDTLLAMEQVRRRGYRRVGLLLSREHNLRTNQNYLAGYLVGRASAQSGADIPVCEASYDDVAAVAVWLRRHQPDAVIACGGRQCLDTIARGGTKVPAGIGVAFPNLAGRDRALSGVVERSEEIGAVAVDVLVAMMQRGERGVPTAPWRIHVEGQWQEGTTLRPVG